MKAATILQVPVKHWYCPNCPQTSVTRELRPHIRFHACRGLYGMTAPFIEVGQKVKVEAHEREDFVANEIVQTDERGKAIMSVVTTRDDGQDTIVFAPTSTARI